MADEIRRLRSALQYDDHPPPFTVASSTTPASSTRWRDHAIGFAVGALVAAALARLHATRPRHGDEDDPLYQPL